MQPDKWEDAIIGTILLVILVFTVVFIFNNDSDVRSSLLLGDDVELALINLLRVETNSGKVSSLIALGEKDAGKIEEFKGEVVKNLNFIFRTRDYLFLVEYPDGRKVEINRGISENVESEISEQIKFVEIPSFNGGVIRLSLVVENE